MSREDIKHGIRNTGPTYHKQNPRATVWPQTNMNRKWRVVSGSEKCSACGGETDVRQRKEFKLLPFCRICWGKVLNGDVETAKRAIDRHLATRPQPLPQALDTERTVGRRAPWNDDPRLRGIEKAFYVECSCRRKFKTVPFKGEYDEDGNPMQAWAKFCAHVHDRRGKLIAEHNVQDWSDRNPFGKTAQKSNEKFATYYDPEKARQAALDEAERIGVMVKKHRKRDHQLSRWLGW